MLIAQHQSKANQDARDSNSYLYFHLLTSPAIQYGAEHTAQLAIAASVLASEIQ